MKLTRCVQVVVGCAVFAGCSGGTDNHTPTTKSPPRSLGHVAEEPSSPAGRKYLLETIDNIAIAQLYDDEFKNLDLRQKLLIWHLTQAGLAGREIYLDQVHPQALEIRHVIEELITHSDGMEGAVKSELEHYAKLSWINSGPYDSNSAKKFVLHLTQPQLLEAAQVAVHNGAHLSKSADEVPATVIGRLAPMLLDPKVDTFVINKSPVDGRDMLEASHGNFYQNVRMSDLKGFHEKYPVTSRLVAEDVTPGRRKLTEQVYKLGGRYGTQLEAVRKHLQAALPFAPAATRTALEAAIHEFQTGEEADRIAAEVAWVKDAGAPVDFIMGFEEVYLDPRGVKAAWETAVLHTDKSRTRRIQQLAGSAQWFEDRMPYAAEFRKPDVKGISAQVADVTFQSGDLGPFFAATGINLPNDRSVREQHGSKSVSLANAKESSNGAVPVIRRTEFVPSPESKQRLAKDFSLVDEMVVDLHEVIGHASGRQAASYKGEPSKDLNQYYSALEEGRADLVALYFVADPKLAELGLVNGATQKDFARSVYEDYAAQAISQLKQEPEGNTLEEDHMRCQQMIVAWLLHNTSALTEIEQEGKTYYRLNDADAFRAGIGRLLAEVQRIKSQGDANGARNLIETYGTHFDPALRDQVLKRVRELNIASGVALVMPKLTPVTGEHGDIVDVKISYPMSLRDQMLDYDGYTSRAPTPQDAGSVGGRTDQPPPTDSAQLRQTSPEVPKP